MSGKVWKKDRGGMNCWQNTLKAMLIMEGVIFIDGFCVLINIKLFFL
jgi:hypothetical protein